MIKIIILALFLVSCSSPMYIEYSVTGTSEQAKIVYNYNGVNVETVEFLPWSKEFISNNGEIGLIVRNTDGIGDIDARVMFIKNNGLQLYERKIHESLVIIKGDIH